ncbi:glycosyltransferase [Marinobacter sp. chi1]|uniref:Glycosyltransferase n=1 Tax=Marinobacter suaedae TaxID=3057675 RepID=A0ABT8W4P9_9GAMM|nr:glycosyltransferase [Marinobacter sp. chi1]MDO3723215.1 glycosyltransferase [Marinobacter sp. chi1]
MTERHLTLAFVIATPGTNWGGMERHTVDLAKGMAERGHTVHVLGHKSYHDHFPPPVTFHRQPVQLGRKNPWLQWTITRCLRDISPDIVHAQGSKAADLVSRSRLSLSTLRLGTVHGIKSNHRAFQHLDAVIAVSQPIFLVLEHPRKRLVPNGVPAPLTPGQSAPAVTDQPDGTINAIAVGRLEPVKGFSKLIEAWSKLVPDERHYHLTIYGEGSERPRLEQLINRHSLAKSVTLAGFQPAMEQVYQEADLTIISSEREALSYVLIESLLAGCPVVSTPIPAIQALLPEQAVSTAHSVESLAQLLSSWLSNLPDLRVLETEAIIFARTHLTLENMIANTESFYLETLQCHHTGTP